jgi:Xaa-Pro aminopeptidase
MFKKNRQKFFQLIEKHPAIIIGGMPILRNGDVHYQFRQISNFYYLTGFDFPNAIAVFIPGKNKKYILFAEIYDEKKILWEGKSYNAKELAQIYKADIVYDIKDFAEKISSLIQDNKSIFANIEINNQHAQQLIKIVSKRRFNNKKIKIDDPIQIFSKMRTYKSKEEIALLKQAISITNQALLKTTKNMKAGMYEYQLQGIFEGKCSELHASRQAFPPIIATGDNACTLHYTKNQSKLKNGDLILFDVGAEFGYYSADVSRTIPVSGKFSSEQARIYQIVLDAQNNGIKKAIPGNTLGDVHSAAVDTIYQGLTKIGIIKNKETLIENKYKLITPFFPHATSHWLGLDVHDLGVYSKDKQLTKLTSGMVITIEPGLYFSKKLKIPKKYQGIGIRIEDDILITQNGNINLSKRFPRTIKSIEKILAQKS